MKNRNKTEVKKEGRGLEEIRRKRNEMKYEEER